jgi:hypothetical protein
VVIADLVQAVAPGAVRAPALPIACALAHQHEARLRLVIARRVIELIQHP